MHEKKIVQYKNSRFTAKVTARLSDSWQASTLLSAPKTLFQSPHQYMLRLGRRTENLRTKIATDIAIKKGARMTKSHLSKLFSWIQYVLRDLLFNRCSFLSSMLFLTKVVTESERRLALEPPIEPERLLFLLCETSEVRIPGPGISFSSSCVQYFLYIPQISLSRTLLKMYGKNQRERKSQNCALEKKHEKSMPSRTRVEYSLKLMSLLNSFHIDHRLFSRILLYIIVLKKRKLPRVETKMRRTH